MITLGIETSCDETGVSLTSGRTVLSNVVTSSVHLHKKYGGVVPEIASRYHVEYIAEVFSRAVKLSGKGLKDVDLVAVTNGPGLVGALLIGISFAKSLSYSLGVPIIGVNHILAHLYSSFLTEKDVSFPFVGLVVSGGHTALFYCKDVGDQKVLGQTQDDAIGEAYDKVSKLLGLGYPGGPIIEKRASQSSQKNKISFPKSYLGKDSLDFSFSGVKTAVLYYMQKVKKPDSRLINDVCYAFQDASLNVLVEKTLMACRKVKASKVVVGGGVAANSMLRRKLLEAGEASGVKAYFPEFRYCMDNAAMVGSLGEELYNRGCRSDLYLTASPNLEV